MQVMSSEVETGSPRPRPLSGGFWSLLSWLRGEDRTSSSESISSAGSDRTTISFAFLAPAHYHRTTIPITLPPPGPPTDSYKKRVYDRNLRRQFDRDITLHRKYGLFRGEANNYDAFSLPSTRKAAGIVIDRQDRDRRATSECSQRRAAHVPGKRRAPPPPPRICLQTGSLRPTNSTNRRHTRKRPAPQPPNLGLENSKDNSFTSYNQVKLMSSQQNHDLKKKESNVNAMDCKSEKYTKKENNIKAKTDKNFLKQIFENRKRSSAVDISSVKVLPSISELDKQASEIIETAKSKQLNKTKQESSSPKENILYCPKCSKKYDQFQKNCLHCKTKQDFLLPNAAISIKNASTSCTQTESNAWPKPSTSRNNIDDEKIRLKEMLKEMKDSLPKRPKHEEKKTEILRNNKSQLISSQETPTLRVGSKIDNKCDVLAIPHTSIEHVINIQDTKSRPIESKGINSLRLKIMPQQKTNNQSDEPPKERNIHTPLKISALLNPIYIPKADVIQSHVVNIPPYLKTEQKRENVEKKVMQTETDPIYIKTADAVRQILLNSDFPKQQPVKISSPTHKKKNVPLFEAKDKIHEKKIKFLDNIAPGNITELSSASNFANNKRNISFNDKVSQHSKRSELVNQLEQSIASGDERAAAEAAMKLAQLRLSCSVLSFTSQILADSSSSTANVKPPTETQITTQADADINQTENAENIARENTFHLKKNSNEQYNNNTKDALIKHSVTTKTPLTSSVLSVATNVANNIPSIKTTTTGSSKVRANPINISTQSIINIKTEKNIISHDSKSCSNQPTVKPPTQANLSINKIQNNDFTAYNNVPSKPSSPQFINPQPTKAESSIQKNISVHIETAPGISVASTSKANKNEVDDNIKSIAVWVEDKEKARGPIQMHVDREYTMGDLRRQAERLLGLPARLQRWIVGRALCNDDAAKLAILAGPNLGAPFYLCLVECDKLTKAAVSVVNKEGNKATTEVAQKKSGDVYNELVRLESQAAVPNAEAFECEICMENCGVGDGTVLRECVHSFCRICLADVIRHCEEPAVPCPATNCPGFLHEREIRALVSAEEYERWLARSLAAAESGTRNAFHCRTRDCSGWALCDAGVIRFPCPVCKHTNCVPCLTIHEGESCEEYRKKLQEASNVNPVDKAEEGTQALIQSLISRGEALLCPECSAIITKKWGCDWVKCSACKTEICWVTRGHRWGPGGRGDTSGGCKCGVDGKRCHPSCGYCH